MIRFTLMPCFHNIITKSTKSCQRLTNSAMILIWLLWRTVESNHADPALPVANPVILVACRAPGSPQSHIPCRRHNLGLGSIIFIHI